MEERPCLWDVNCKDYKSRDERNKALNEIEDVIGIPPNEIKTKIISLRSQLGREMGKTVKTKSGQSADDLYKSNWAYWDRLQFLQPVMKPGKSRDTFDTCNDDSEQEGRNSPDPDPQISVHSTPKISKKAYETKKSELLSTCISVLKEPVSKPAEKEQCHFSMHIAQKLAQFDRRKRAIAEKRINDIVFELEMIILTMFYI
eukprot:Seg788.15 transcript_id=Seg788.15/GoldUCD/mRNA.D3Y31 product="hypothetical protein" protein_id=Seg788.15/GoldUCD/D3Y31